MKALIKKREGIHGVWVVALKTIKPKWQSDGTPTGGNYYVCWGHQVPASDKDKIFNYPTDCDNFLNSDYNRAKGIANGINCPDGRMSFSTLPCSIQGALIDMAYQWPTFTQPTAPAGAPKFVAAICSCNWAEAKKQLLDVAMLGKSVINALLDQGGSCDIPSSI